MRIWSLVGAVLLAIVISIVINEHANYTRRFVGRITPEQWAAIERETFVEWQTRVLQPGHRVVLRREVAGIYVMIARVSADRLACYHKDAGPTVPRRVSWSDRYLDSQGTQYRLTSPPESLSSRHEVIENHYFHWSYTVEAENHAAIYTFTKSITGKLRIILKRNDLELCDETVDWDMEPAVK